jgi:biotin carboxyl carrier protein
MANYTIFIDNQNIEFTLDDGFIKHNLHSINADIVKITENEYSILYNGKSLHFFISKEDDSDFVIFNGINHKIKAYGFKEKLLNTLKNNIQFQHKEIIIKAPIPGLIINVLKVEQTQIHEGEGILIIEAMKMENEIRSPKSGILKKILVFEKQTVEKNEPLFIVE